ncbi:hypothetical protein OYT1_ch0343 [Ferriphaselus amnicola]|uniref:Glycine zipper domain-containing protein n=1 Tax=Ferriphaselus amnicola TaxID=1188319 RepID=A0A2Z6G8W0_9PROT|nr:hypothetical protein [Ferriphaselus amnicola]BBE49916.1 hypothetical protein OYT1_ch0343 [Ferriphaselus amnicola]
MKKILVVGSLLLLAACVNPNQNQAVLGGAVGGGVGAGVGQAVGGQGGAILGGAIGGAVGAAVSTGGQQQPVYQPRGRDYDDRGYRGREHDHDRRRDRD